MIGDAFVFDGVAHPFNFDAEERLRPGRADVLQPPLRLPRRR